jgi:hypothetical protein
VRSGVGCFDCCCGVGLGGLTFAAVVGGFTGGRSNDLGGQTSLGHLKSPFCCRKTTSLSFSGMLPRAELSTLQQATQLSSELLPPFAEATRCSTLASPEGSVRLQKKQFPPWM